MAQIGIVTVLYNSENVLDEFFYSLDKQDFKDFILYVIDNASTDHGLSKTKELAKKVSFKTKIFEETQNLGIAKGNNIGIKDALKDGCEYILLSNNDVVLNNPKTLSILLNRIVATNSAIITPKILKYSDHSIIWAAGGKFLFLGTRTKHIGANKFDCSKFSKEREISYTPTCFTLIKIDVFKKIGLMDEDYFVYYDDTDFMRRASLNGFKIFYTPYTSILHNESSITGKMSYFKIYQLSKNQIIYTRKNFSKLILRILLIRNWLIHLTYHKIKFNKTQLDAERNGLLEGVRYSIED